MAINDLIDEIQMLLSLLQVIWSKVERNTR